MSLQGSLDTFALPDVLALLATTRKSGELHIAGSRGVALARPEAFVVAAAGEESDLIFSVEEASFRLGRWSARGILSGGLILRVELPGELPLKKGRLLPLRFDPTRFTLLKRD